MFAVDTIRTYRCNLEWCLYLSLPQDGTSEDDVIKGVPPGGDGSVILAGHTKGAWNGPNDGSNDFAAVKLDANGTVVWRWQVLRILRLQPW